MTTLVFGGTGLIGEAICEGIPDAVGVGSECDIADDMLVRGALNYHLPDNVINAAWPVDVFHLEGFQTVMEKVIDFFQKTGRRGCLINIASIYAHMLPKDIYPEGMSGPTPDYAAAKAAIVQLTRYWARKVRGSGIRVNAVSPGGVYRDEPRAFVDAYSAQTNHGTMLPAQAVAQACRFLVYCPWVAGQNLVVADGFDLG